MTNAELFTSQNTSTQGLGLGLSFITKEYERGERKEGGVDKRKGSQ